jgi:hypothetical protein
VLIEALSSESEYTTTDFYLYGTQITWRNADAAIPGTAESSFYATETDVDGIWKLYWDDETAASTKGTIVVLKNVPS